MDTKSEFRNGKATTLKKYRKGEFLRPISDLKYLWVQAKSRERNKLINFSRAYWLGRIKGMRELARRGGGRGC